MAPRTTSRGAKSPPIASTAMRTSATRRGASCRSALPLCGGGHLDRDSLPAVVVAARRTDVVGALQFVAMVALDQRWSADGQVGAALALAGLGNLSLGDAHANNSCAMTGERRSIAGGLRRGRGSVFRALQEPGQGCQPWIGLIGLMEMHAVCQWSAACGA